ncbi:hypothetical protein [Haladaptatus cibarius]|uniref:hypothetical protein n=1 Tax=Haladaptatus cibarius TaxID=453847 RepID=UPI0006798532|nr:hypothetical protein [Haladaptatus cibarius]
MTDPELAARRYVLSEHTETVTSLLCCADSVAESWNDEATADETNVTTNRKRSTTDREAVVEPLSRTLREYGLLAEFPTVLSGAISAGGFSMQAAPVPAPPYVAITSRGPVLRATVSAGRLVISFRVFDVVRDGHNRYVRGANDPETAVSVELK